MTLVFAVRMIELTAQVQAISTRNGLHRVSTERKHCPNSAFTVGVLAACLRDLASDPAGVFEPGALTNLRWFRTPRFTTLMQNVFFFQRLLCFIFVFNTF